MLENFVVVIYLINFAMTKEPFRRISIWEKISDFMMDISKYVLTAVLITSAFEELSDVTWVMYLVGVLGSALIFGGSILFINFNNKKL